jgi:hypothetical protein
MTACHRCSSCTQYVMYTVLTEILIYVQTSYFRCVLNELCAPLGCDASVVVILYWRFGTTYWVPPSRAKKRTLTIEDGTNRVSRNIGKKYQYTLRHIPEEYSTYCNFSCFPPRYFYLSMSQQFLFLTKFRLCARHKFRHVQNFHVYATVQLLLQTLQNAIISSLQCKL